MEGDGAGESREGTREGKGGDGEEGDGYTVASWWGGAGGDWRETQREGERVRCVVD